jgi:hypothetical protein
VTFTVYSPGEATNRDKVRGKIGDTDENRQLLQDETIEAVLVTYPTIIGASIECCKRIIARLARDVDRSAVGMSASRSQVIQHYKDLIEQLKDEATSTLGAEGGSGGGIYAGGVSQAAIDTLESDTDFVKPTFRVGLHDNADATTSEDAP